MLYKKYVSMMVVMALLLCLTMPAKVNAESRQPCGPDAWYELSEDGTLVISGTGEITKKFGEDSAVQHKIKKIIMEEGIEKIGERAFAFCNAKEVDLPQTLKKIGEQAFYYTLIKTVNIPQAVSEYGKDIFMHSDVETAYLDAFAHETNVDVNNRMVVYDIMDLGKQLKTMGLLVITDAMLNRVTENWKKGKRTHIFLDEFHVVFENEHSGTFFNSAWRRFRKRNAFPTAITQNVEYLLDSVLASTMLSNSEYIVMLNQAASDRQKLAELLNISNEQMSYITNADAGCGLIKYGSSLVPFVNKFPKDTRLYKLMTTKPGEDYANRSRM